MLMPIFIGPFLATKTRFTLSLCFQHCCENSSDNLQRIYVHCWSGLCCAKQDVEHLKRCYKYGKFNLFQFVLYVQFCQTLVKVAFYLCMLQPIMIYCNRLWLLNMIYGKTYYDY